MMVTPPCILHRRRHRLAATLPLWVREATREDARLGDPRSARADRDRGQIDGWENLLQATTFGIQVASAPKEVDSPSSASASRGSRRSARPTRGRLLIC
jgi:hypothetical protein